MDRWLPKQVAGIVGSRGLDAGYSWGRIYTSALRLPFTYRGEVAHAPVPDSCGLNAGSKRRRMGTRAPRLPFK